MDHIQAIIPFIAVGFFAQLVDGALGMAFGVITNTMLVTVMGVPRRALLPASISSKHSRQRPLPSATRCTAM